jgi:hypothetical protein
MCRCQQLSWAGNWSARFKKSLTCRKSLLNKLYHIMLYRVHNINGVRHWLHGWLNVNPTTIRSRRPLDYWKTSSSKYLHMWEAYLITVRRPITRNISTLYDPWTNCSQTIVSSFRMYVGFHNRKRVPLAEQELPCPITPVGFVLTFLLCRIAYSHVFFILCCDVRYNKNMYFRDRRVYILFLL